MHDDDRSKTDQIVDLLVDALLERQRGRGDEIETVIEIETELEEELELEDVFVPEPVFEPEVLEEEVEDVVVGTPALSAAETAVPWMPEKLPSIHLEKMLGKLAVVMALLLIVVNIPFNRFGTSLARAMPDTASLIIRDGLVLKGEGEKIYVLEDNKKRWISTLDAFEYYGYRWQQVRVVDEPFLEQFEDGLPIYLLLKCNNSPHVYALENGEKRWIKDIPTFVANGFVWEEIQFVSCNRLRDMPDGIPIPPDAGTPPQP
ncbi:MAG: hypothetical protein DWQ04_29180 [Chloroflexi bacterium]|nr:MAG: hypothetical protein DWQ04_29180 [Chloroflexota bacterium]